MSSGMTPRPLQGRHSFVLSRTMRPPVVTVSTYPRPPHSWHGTLTETVSSTEECSPPSISRALYCAVREDRAALTGWSSTGKLALQSIYDPVRLKSGLPRRASHASRRRTAPSAGNRWPQDQRTDGTPLSAALRPSSTSGSSAEGRPSGGVTPSPRALVNVLCRRHTSRPSAGTSPVTAGRDRIVTPPPPAAQLDDLVRRTPPRSLPS